ncbi:MAG: type II toxin-antitoxin system RelE/ParE family toxin [Blastomonas fulva]|uniref:type II toxin-antitoxin system RelE/ParE family toxin n=1 Tax=Blastomonas fulva TaxID=1550728 RepID=UPI0040349488
MKPIVFLPAAEADIEAIWDYSAERWGESQADLYTDEIVQACEGFASGSRPGKPVDVRPGLFKYRVSSHVIYFRNTSSRIVVIRVLHGAQDVERNL